MYGMMPVTVSRSNPTDFSVGRGFLHSTTGEGWWRLEHDDDAARTLRTLLERQRGQLPTASGEKISTNALAEGLLNFQYSRFKIDLIETPDGLLARLTTRGRSRDPKAPIQFEGITLDFPGFDENLRKLLVLKGQIGRKMNETPEDSER